MSPNVGHNDNLPSNAPLKVLPVGKSFTIWSKFSVLKKHIQSTGIRNALERHQIGPFQEGIC